MDPTLVWIVVAGVAMAAIALVGGLTTVLPEALFERILPGLVGLAAGALLGGAFFHLLPTAIDELGNDLTVHLWTMGGFLAFFGLEEVLHWHHHRRPHGGHAPEGWLILLGDGLHNFLGGLAIGGSFLVDIRTGAVAWLAAAAHEVPQELGDFGILRASGWGNRKALALNALSASSFLVGAVLAYLSRGVIETGYLLPFAAGNFIYIGAADLVPYLTEHAIDTRTRAIQAAAFVGGLALLAATAVWLG